ncbi:uncharacterized protein [Epargyreus clarus]|uniref:uncharacterized protein n=1 Tax=Epargyreus clarus TaxID=520877 RepID=UPI003C2F7B36
MELNEITVTTLSSGNVSQDMGMQQMDRPRKCPLCSNEIKFYFINLFEKIQMCENLQCDYPFGHVPLKIIKEENGVHTIEVKSRRSKKSTCSNTTTFVSTSGWADVEKLCNLLESAEDITNMEVDTVPNVILKKKAEEQERKEAIQRNVEQIKKMTTSMNNIQKGSKSTIKNEKWLKNLSYLQGLSGFNLVKPEEMKKIRKKVHILGNGELKIDIDKNNSSSIKIEINHPTGSNVRLA